MSSADSQSIDPLAMRLDLEYPAPKRGSAVVWGQVGASPFGGMIWQVLHHLAALRLLGFDTWYVEDSDRLVWDPRTWDLVSDHSQNVSLLSRYMEAAGFGNRWVFRPPGVNDRCEGRLDLAGLHQLYRHCVVALNVCGSQEVREEHSRIACRLYLETDPGWNQVLVAQGDAARIAELDAHDHHFTYGENIGSDDCRIPVTRYHWLATRPPVVGQWWSTTRPPAGALTTVANWKHGSKDVEWQGETWRWSKHVAFKRFLDLPRTSSLPLELSVGAISQEDRDELRRHGWRLRASESLERADAYRHYIQQSLGEFSVAKEQYVLPRSGWFSDRSACYLAAGRPVILQDTGFARYVPTGEGLFAFTGDDDVLAAIDAIRTDYARHSAAARAIASEYFDAETLLRRVLSAVGLL
ncbi:MAG TPA: hypothetical protein VNA04_07120 [Thermoanaerobaculia bacterium]|nr:hypothetical protein [Thermoanaerobaculia bacterium]